jgi:hypothetical protein
MCLLVFFLLPDGSHSDAPPLQVRGQRSRLLLDGSQEALHHIPWRLRKQAGFISFCRDCVSGATKLFEKAQHLSDKNLAATYRFNH